MKTARAKLGLPALWGRLRTGIAESVGELFPSATGVELKAAADDGWRIDEPDAYCRRCGASAGPGAVTPRGCSACVGKPIAWRRIVRLSAYQPPLDAWIVAMKFGRVWPWGVWFGRELAPLIGDVGDPKRTVICPVPMPWLRRWRRGYNQAQIIADALAKARGLATAKLLRRKGWQPPQTSLPASRRADNVRHSFEPIDVDLTGWDVWLVDDVKTTGSTLGACARLLKKAGAANVFAAVAAVADPKHADFKVK